uniref:FAD-binding domain-containing protein n=1 Tax=Chlamydomonas euryale TaxID=1486919 RepID=A0A7R9VQH3_9CHLO
MVAAAHDHDVLIVGGGPGGLATAHALSKVLPSGSSIGVLERNPNIHRPQGAGISLDANGLKALRAIDAALYESVAASELSTSIKASEMRTKAGEVTRTIPGEVMEAQDTMMLARYGVKSVQLPWHDLVMVLFHALPKSVEFMQGVKMQRYEQLADGSVAVFVEGKEQPVTARLLVASDGYFSPVRRQLLDDGPPDFKDVVIFRTTISEEQAVAAGFKAGYNVLYFDEEACGLLFRTNSSTYSLVVSLQTWHLEKCGVDPSTLLRTGDAVPGLSGSWELSRKLDLEHAKVSLQTALNGWDPALMKAIASLPADRWVVHGVYCRSSAKMDPSHFGAGNVAIVGDAAHPIRPTGQGANMALEDAYFLAQAVGRDPIGLSALGEFRAARAERMRPVMRQSEVGAARAYKRGAAAEVDDPGAPVEPSDPEAENKQREDEQRSFRDFLYGVVMEPLRAAEVAKA